MTAKDDALKDLRDSGMLKVLTWAAPAAFTATDQLFDEDAGHDQGVVGYLNFKHLKDLIDRATSNGRFRLGEDVDGAGPDFLKRGITPDVFRSMPSLPPGAIIRSDYRQSPGWAAGDHRVVLQSYPFGGVDDIKWAERSDAKRRVAAQGFFTEGDVLFDPADFGLEVLTGIPDDDAFAGVTLVAAHAFHPVTKQSELYVGQSKNPAYPGDDCWHWKHPLLTGGGPLGGSGRTIQPALPGDSASADVEDVAVRIKKTAAGEEPGASNG